MRPLQLWLPMNDSAAALGETRRDLDRARAQWGGQSRVWLAPWYEKRLSWTAPGKHQSQEIALPSEAIDRVDVIHVGENGFLGPNWSTRFVDFSVEGLLDAWLNYLKGGKTIDLYPAPESTTRWFPFLRDGRIGVSPIRLATTAAGGSLQLSEEPWPPDDLPIDDGDTPSGDLLTFQWPPDEVGWKSVAPAEESRALFGRQVPTGVLDPDSEDPIRVYSSELDPENKTLGTRMLWNHPFDRLFLEGAGVDAIDAQARMVHLAETHAADPDDSLRTAERWSDRFLSDGSVPRFHVWFSPTIAKVGLDGFLWEVEGQFGKSFETHDEMRASEGFQQWLREPVPVTVCYGVLGVLWALFLDRLREGKTFRACERCGRALEGPRNKRFCGPRDDKKCYRSRRNEAKSRERQRKRSGQPD